MLIRIVFGTKFSILFFINCWYGGKNKTGCDPEKFVVDFKSEMISTSTDFCPTREICGFYHNLTVIVTGLIKNYQSVDGEDYQKSKIRYLMPATFLFYDITGDTITETVANKLYRRL